MLNQLIYVIYETLIGTRWCHEGDVVDAGSPERAAKLQRKGVGLVIGEAEFWLTVFDDLPEDLPEDDWEFHDILVDYFDSIQGPTIEQEFGCSDLYALQFALSAAYLQYETTQTTTVCDEGSPDRELQLQTGSNGDDRLC